MKALRFVLVVPVLGLAAGIGAALLNGHGRLVLIGAAVAAVLAALFILSTFLNRDKRLAQWEEREELSRAAVLANPSNRVPVMRKYLAALESDDPRVILETLNVLAAFSGTATPEYIRLQRMYVSRFGVKVPYPVAEPADLGLIERLYGSGDSVSSDDFLN